MIIVAVVAVARVNGCNGADFAKAHPRQFVAHDRAQRCDQLAHADAPCTVSAVMKPCPESSRWSTSSTRRMPGELPGKPAISTRSPGRHFVSRVIMGNRQRLALYPGQVARPQEGLQ